MNFAFVFDGYLADVASPSLFVFDGYLISAVSPFTPVFPDKGLLGGGGRIDNRGIIEIEDDEILLLINAFLICQS